VTNIEYGQRLRDLRAELGLSLREVEERGGPSKDVLSPIERGVHKPRAQTLGKIAQVFGISVSELRTRLEADTPKVSTPPSREWALVASDEEFDGWVQGAKAGELHKLWNSLSDYAKGIENAERRAYVRDRAQKAIDQFFRLLPVKEIIAWKSSMPEETEGREAG